jgi:hypothetical protein
VTRSAAGLATAGVPCISVQFLRYAHSAGHGQALIIEHDLLAEEIPSIPPPEDASAWDIPIGWNQMGDLVSVTSPTHALCWAG